MHVPDYMLQPPTPDPRMIELDIEEGRIRSRMAQIEAITEELTTAQENEYTELDKHLSEIINTRRY
jgi:hypothetical protein